MPNFFIFENLGMSHFPPSDSENGNMGHFEEKVGDQFQKNILHTLFKPFQGTSRTTHKGEPYNLSTGVQLVSRSD